MNLEAKIEALLFARGEPVLYSFLASFLKESDDRVREALSRLHESYAGKGLAVVDNGETVALRTAPEASALIERLRKDELERELSKAALETLSIVLYAGPVTRATIDFIRGVNSQFILRSLLIRGLLERAADEEDPRRMLYRPTVDLLSHLGASKAETLPGYAEFRAKLNASAERTETENEKEAPANA